MKYKRILIKLSGEALLNNKEESVICAEQLAHAVKEIKSVVDLGLELIIVLGGGNILRGSTSKLKLVRYKADNMGMLATVINAVALEDALTQQGISTKLLSAIEINKVCEFYNADIANKYLSEKKVIICAGGINNPYFSTDTCAVIRALELNAELIFKGTQVDGVYNKDPKQFSDATRFNEISYSDVLSKKLKIFDATAICLAESHKLPIVVFNIHKSGNLKNLLQGNENISIIK